MNLEELQAEYPHGSRWHVAARAQTVVVIGWMPEDQAVVYRGERDHGEIHWSGLALLDGWKRLPDKGSSPITEPTTVYITEDGRVWQTATVTPHPAEWRVTLHPPDVAFVGGGRPKDHWGYYTWSDR